MELHERLARPRPGGRDAQDVDPFAERQEPHPPGGDRGRSGRSLFNADDGPDALRRAGPAGHPTASWPRSRASPATTAIACASEIADDILGHGPLERLLADDTRHGDHGQRPLRRLDRAPGPPLRDDGAVQRRLAPAPDHQQDRRPGRAADRRVVADGGRAPARRQPRQRGHPAALAHRPARHDPQVQQAAAGTCTTWSSSAR